MPFEIVDYSSETVKPVLPLLQEWVEREFLKYPYLWVAPKNVIYHPNQHLDQEERALSAVVKQADEVVGVMSCMPFDSTALEDSLQQLLPALRERQFDPSQLLYVSYCLATDHSDTNLTEAMVQHLFDHARKIGCSQICFMKDLGRPDHPLKPESDVSIEPWGDEFKSMGIELEIAWPTLQADGSAQEEAHTMVFFYKEI